MGPVLFWSSPVSGLIKIRKGERTTFGPCAFLEAIAILSAYCRLPANSACPPFVRPKLPVNAIPAAPLAVKVHVATNAAPPATMLVAVGMQVNA
jgi:hypothetical protein